MYRSGAGGRGEIAEKGGGRMVDNFKYQPGGSLPKRIWLNNSDPADGYEGSSIVYVLIKSCALPFGTAFCTLAHTPACCISVISVALLVICSISA